MSDEARIEAAFRVVMQRHGHPPKNHFGRISIDRSDIKAALAAADAAGDTVTVSRDDLRVYLTVIDDMASTIWNEWRGWPATPQEHLKDHAPDAVSAIARLRAIVEANT